MDQARRTIPLRSRLRVLAAVAVLPVAAAAAIGLLALVHDQYKAAEAKSMEVAQLAAASIEMEAQRTSAMLRGLAASPLIERGDLAAFGVLLVRAQAEMQGQWYSVGLARPDGTVVRDTRVPAGGPMPSIRERDSFDRVVATHAAAFGNLRRGADGAWGVPVRVPVLRGGRLLYVLSAVLKPDALIAVIRSQRLPAGWVMSVFDASNARIARSEDQPGTVGGKPSPSLEALMRAHPDRGMGITHSLENREIYTAYLRTPSGWTTAIGIPTGSALAAGWRAIGILGGGQLLSLILAVALATLAARGINQPIVALREGAGRLGRGETPVLPPTRIEELQGLGRSMVAAAGALRQLELERSAAIADLVTARDDLRGQVADLERLHRLSSTLLKMDAFEAQLETVLVAFCELHGTSRGMISLTSASRSELHLQVAVGFSAEAQRRLACVTAGAGACGLALREDRRVVVEDVETDPCFEGFRDLARAEGFRSVHSTPVRGTAGKVLGVLSVHPDAPGFPSERQVRLADLIAHLLSVFLERAQAQAVASQSERRLAVALDSSFVPFSILVPVRDATGAIVDFVWEHTNRAAAGAIGKQPEDLVGQRVAAIVPDVWHLPGLFEACVAVAQNAESREFELCTPPGMPEHWLHVVATPFEGKVAIWTSEITERKQQERALQLADRRKDEFLAILAHELRNPLAPIQQAAMIASASSATEAQQRWSQEVIVRQVKHMSLLLDDLLDISRITRGKLELRKSRIALGAAIEAAVETARPHLEAKGHHLEVVLPPEPLYITADALRVAQIVTNLLTNAARYTGVGGSLRLSARAEGELAVVTVADNGVGIPAAQLDSIFEMFSQGRPGTPHGGLGIGLALSRGLAGLHGGTLVAASAGPGQGSCFTLTLPRGEGASAGAVERPLPLAAASLRIVVADDNRDAAETLASLLRLASHQVRVAYDGEGAVRAFADGGADAVILDIGMPGISGYEAARRIRASARPDQAQPLLVALTGWGQARDRANALGAGFDHHLTKPVDAHALFTMLAALRTAAAPRVAPAALIQGEPRPENPSLTR